MGKFKIPKNRSDQEMLANWQEKATFETEFHDEVQSTRKSKQTVKNQSDFHSSFFTPELQEKVGKAILDMKLSLFKEGIVDFDIKVTQEKNKIILTAVPRQEKSAIPKKY